MKFWTRNSSSITEKVRLHANGVLAASAGIALGSGLANTAANTLHDYEEGTWTPAIKSGGTLTIAGIVSATYTKIGRSVTVQAYINLANNGNA